MFYLARVFLSLVVSSAEERFSDDFFVSGPGEHVLALLVLDDRNAHLVQDAGNAAAWKDERLINWIEIKNGLLFQSYFLNWHWFVKHGKLGHLKFETIFLYNWNKKQPQINP